MSSATFIRRLVMMITVCLLAVSSVAQQQLVVYSVKGKAAATTNGKTEDINEGMVILADAAIQLPDISTGVILICETGNMFTMRGPGNFSVAQRVNCPSVQKKKKKEAHYPLINFAQFLWYSSTRNPTPLGPFRKAFLSTVGAVTGPNSDFWVNTLLDTLNYSGLEADFNLPWICHMGYTKALFTLYGINDPAKALFDTTLDSPGIPISSFIGKMERGRSYYWAVSAGQQDNWSLQLLNFVTESVYRALQADIHNQKPAFESPAREALRTAFMLEYAHYTAEAAVYYKKAVELAPGNSFYQSVLTSFQKDFRAFISK